MNFIQPESSEEVNIPEITRQYEIGLDYGFKRDGETIYFFIKVAVNQVKEPKLGYVLFCEGVGVLNAAVIKSLPEADAQSWRVNAISFGISQLRAYIDSITAFGPFGKYTLPLIDLVSLIKSKNELRVKKTGGRESGVRKLKKEKPVQKKG